MFDLDADTVFGCVVVGVVVVLVLIGITAIFADHAPQRYYLGTGGVGYCAYVQKEWDADSSVFCSDDINKTLDVIQRANLTLKGLK